MSFDFKLKKFIYGFYGDKNGRNQRWLSPFTDTERQCLLRQDLFRNIEMPVYDNLSLEYQRGYMMDQVLVKVDRASMFNSLEVRAPFLETRVVEFSNSLPIDFKMRGFQGKYILKKLMSGKIPDSIIHRKKKGFGMPIAEWIRADLRGEIETILGVKSLEKIGVFNVEYVQKIIKEHMDGKKDNRKQIWTLFVFALWWKKWLK